jgi:hypothetical protein
MPTTRGAPEMAMRQGPIHASLDIERRSVLTWLSPLLGWIMLAATLALPIHEAAARRGGQPEVITFNGRDTTRLEALEPRSPGAHWTQTVRKPVSDLMLRLRGSGGQPLDAALAAPGLDRPGQLTVLFEAELILAAAGRIHVEDRAVCGPWQGDIIVCRTECDGGAFALARRSKAGDLALTLLVGKVPSLSDAGFGDTVRLGACSDTQASGGLAAKAGTVAEIPLDRR